MTPKHKQRQGFHSATEPEVSEGLPCTCCFIPKLEEVVPPKMNKSLPTFSSVERFAFSPALGLSSLFMINLKIA